MGGTWRDVAKLLKLSNDDIEMVELEVHTKREQAHSMLFKWQFKFRDNAKIEIVKKAMKHIEEKNEAEAVNSK